METNRDGRVRWGLPYILLAVFLVIDGIVYVALGPVSEKIVVVVRADPEDVRNFNEVREIIEGPSKFGIGAKLALVATVAVVGLLLKLRRLSDESTQNDVDSAKTRKGAKGEWHSSA